MDGTSLFLGFCIGFVAAIIAVIVGLAIVTGTADQKKEIQE